MNLEKKFLDTNIKTKSQIIDESLSLYKGKYPLPSLVEISNSGTCNRKCSFCPRSDPSYEDVNEFISNKLHDKICTELSEYKYNGILVYSGFNEPLLKKDVFRDISKAKELLPNAKIQMITNGDVLSEARLKLLFASGLTTLLVSVYDGEKEFRKFEEMGNKLKLSKQQYVLRKRYLSEEKDFGITMSNRSGLLAKAEYSIKPLDKSFNTSCNYPSYTFFIDYNGEVLMCSHDWGKKRILGNVSKNSILEIWSSKIASDSRKKLLNKNRNFLPCSKCDVKGDLIGNKHASAWKNYEK
jgi:radical SAM protein with 4Fe4S-binding SPASM domain